MRGELLFIYHTVLSPASEPATPPVILTWTSRRYDSGIMPQARHMVLLEGILGSPILQTRSGFILRYPVIFLYVFISASFMMQITAMAFGG